MTREEARKAAEVMLAYADGKEVELLIEGSGWFPYEGEEPYFDWANYEYRIKPEPTYRPFKDAEECWQEMQKHQPFGWVKRKDSGTNCSIMNVSSTIKVLELSAILCVLFGEAMNEYTFADGTPFGVKEKEV